MVQSDMLPKDYLGEVSIPLEDQLDEHQEGAKDMYGFDDPKNKVCCVAFIWIM